MKYIVYRTENLVNKNFYYGVHKTEHPDIFDGYLGSGELLIPTIKKYGKHNFIRRTIKVFDTREEAEHLEALIVDQDFVNRYDCLNLCWGGGKPRKEVSNETRAKLSEAAKGKNNPMYGKEITNEHRANLKKAWERRKAKSNAED